MKMFYAILMLFPLTSFAVDGVLEINQACIDAGCFPGDTAALPILITNPGSYRLTSNIDISSYDSPEDLNVIEIYSGNVALDLNGFTITGSTTCTGSPVTSCSPTGNGIGVSTTGGIGISISNGFIKGMGYYGLYCGSGCRVSNMVVSESGGHGITGGTQGLYLNNISYRNGDGGILAVGVLIGNSAQFNKSFGIQSYNGRLDNNIVTSNGGAGVVCTDCSISNSYIFSNGGHGIFFSGGSTYGGNTMDVNSLGSTGGVPALQIAPNFCATGACP